MESNDIKKDILIQDWYATVRPPYNTWRGHIYAITKYCMFLNKSPTQLIDEAEEDATKPPRQRRVRQDMNSYNTELVKRGLAESSIHTYFVSIESFYRAFDIEITRTMKRKRAVPTKENMKIPTVEELRHVIERVGLLERAIVLVGCASGLAQNEIMELRIKDFNDGYDSDTGITTLHVRRAKTNYDHITFLTPEASDAVLKYLEYRSMPPLSDDLKSKYAAEKRHVRADTDYLFIKTRISDKYLTSYDEELRKMRLANVLETYQRISREVGMESSNQWNLIRSHNMRKYFNSALLNAGCDSFHVEYWMGHTLDSTRSAYFRASPEKLKDIYAKYIPALTISPEMDIENTEQYKELAARKDALESERVRVGLAAELSILQRKEDQERIKELERRQEAMAGMMEALLEAKRAD